jgi:hypothetical protein
MPQLKQKDIKAALKRLNINLPDKNRKAYVKTDEDIAFLKKILPHGLKATSLYTRSDGRFTTYLIADVFPAYIPDLLLARIFDQFRSETVTLDISFKPKNETVQDVENGINELSNRWVINRNVTENMNDAYEKRDLAALHEELQLTKEAIAYITMRFVVTANSENELEARVEEIKTDMNIYGINVCVPENEMLSEFRGLQDSADTIRQAIPVYQTLARQFPFFFQSHVDPKGRIWGDTSTKGIVAINTFHTDNDRKSWDVSFTGKKGSGKTASLCCMIQEELSFGSKIMIFDIEGALGKFAERLGGCVISPVSESGRVNLLHLYALRSAKYEREEGQLLDEKAIIRANYAYAMSRIMSIFYILKPGMSDEQADMLMDLLQVCFTARGITENTNLEGLSPDRFPVMSDLLATIRDALYRKYDKDSDNCEYRPSLTERKRNILEYLESAIKPYAEGIYAPIFNGASTVDISKEDLVVFDMSLLSEMEDSIFNAQMMNIFGLMWGEVYKNRQLNDGIPEELARRCVCVFDEAQHIITPRYPKVLNFIEQLARRDRKYLAALWYASQKPRDYCPSGASEHFDKVKNIFSLVQYKVLMQQDESDYEIIEELFPEFTRSDIESTSSFGKGKMLVSMGGGKKMQCTRLISKDYLDYFGGGL